MNKIVLEQEFKKLYPNLTPRFFSCGGRFEILGNHTDHNHGLCLAATCDLEVVAAAQICEGNNILFVSKNYTPNKISLLDLKPVEKDKITTMALIRGVAEYLVNHGYKVGAFSAYSESNIFPGAGVSSSAAFELLVAQIINHLFNDGKIPMLVLAKAGQYAENVHFGKASGLLDQIGVSYGNLSFIDFENIESPVVETVNYKFNNLHFVIINTGGNHATLSHLYSAIPNDMYNAAHKAGVNYLRETTFEEVKKNNPLPVELNRAKHFYDENQRVLAAIKAIKEGDQYSFVKAINESRMSSTLYLKNMMPGNDYIGSPLEACDYFMEITHNQGAIKVNGGGFAGSVIAVVPDHLLEHVMRMMKMRYGDNNVVEVHIRKEPAGEIL